ncbi:iron-siderophore ABC transporter substrate-binding protein [Rothia nasimurium]|uniref:Iron-siderophore ABC transporter substrate-binding protein n=1 Tax=Rothia nasimurium TaxID=85336 RepID=A0A4Y9F561_9MICC|nr:iron-siderophore ABC transporter substrate-binding protein [Rothia nasimurium]MBF0807588.1 iron-siderophore ABC transporter substrate-binding protein [Rothia nasimurium]TFU23518.1 iron-siderophore ABC transporter substrate-binding protein [Rothia nasimurium]
MATLTSKTARTISLCATLTALALTSACGSSSTTSETSSSSSSSAAASASSTTEAASAPTALPDGMGASEADGVFPRTVTHFGGQTTIETQPQKVVVLSTGQLDDVLTLGVAPIASTTATDAELVPSYLSEEYGDDFSSLNDLQTVGTRKAPDTEAIANLAPDLILINSTNKDEALMESLQAIAPVVVTEGTGVNWKQDYLLIAAALGKTEQAQADLDEYTARAAALGEKVDDSTTFSFLRYTSDRTRIWGVSSFVGSIAADAGLARPESQTFADTSQDISAEQLDLADGDYLFYGAQGGDGAGLTDAALWSSLGAVAAGKAYQVDDEMFFLNAGMTAANEVLDTLEETVSSN